MDDFPVPEGPNRQTNSPRLTSRLMSSRITLPPCFTVKLVKEMAVEMVEEIVLIGS